MNIILTEAEEKSHRNAKLIIKNTFRIVHDIIYNVLRNNDKKIFECLDHCLIHSYPNSYS